MDFLLAGAVCVLAFGVYAVSGARPDLAGAPFGPRLAELRASDLDKASLEEHIALLRVVTRERPTDPQAWRFLAMALEASGQKGEAEFARAKADWIAAEAASLISPQPGAGDNAADVAPAAPALIDGDAP